MALRFLLDEHLRGAMSGAIQQHNAAGVDPIDTVRVGDPQDLPLGSVDPDILVWAEREGRILVSLDKRTLPGYLAQHLQAGRHALGILIIRQLATIPQVVAYLANT